MNMNYKVSLSRVSAKYLKRTDQVDRKRIIEALEGLKYNLPTGDILTYERDDGPLSLTCGGIQNYI